MRKPSLLAALRRLAVITTAAAAAPLACIEDVDLGQFQEAASAGSETGGAAGSPSVSAGGAGGEAGEPACVPTACAGVYYACGDCVDNDQDGFTDAADSQCLGPCDNTENSFFGGIPGQNNAPCRQDCYFDSDTGPGNDGCYWSHRCDELSLAEDYPPSGNDQCAYDEDASIPGSSASCSELRAEQSEECEATCMPYVPNGCDCFGCCELPAGSGQFVWLGSNSDGAGSCSEETLGDATACRPCTPVPSCFNECDECEVCAGRPEPAETCGAPDDNSCGPDYQPCGRPGQPACPSGTYCITGCCITVPR